MNLVTLQERLKDFSEQQLVSEMQMPSGQVPQFLLLTELNRRKRMADQHQLDMAQGDQQTVAQDLLATAGLPAVQAGQMAGAMAPQTDMMGNTAAMQAPQPQAPQQRPPMPGGPGGPVMMREGGIVALRDGGRIGSQAPSTFVSGGIQYIVNERGDAIPWGIADVTSGANIGYGEDTPDRFPPTPEDIPTGVLDPPRPARPTSPEDVRSWTGDMGALASDVIGPPLRRLDAIAETPGQTRAPFPLNMTPAQLEAYTTAAQSPGITGVGQNLLDSVEAVVGPASAAVRGGLGRAASYLGMPGVGAPLIQAADDIRERLAQNEQDRIDRDARRSLDTDFIRFATNPTPEGAARVLPSALQAQDPIPDAQAERESAEPPADPTGPGGGGAGGAGGAAGAGGSGGAGGAGGAGGIGGAPGAAAPGSFEEFLQQRMESAEADRRRDQWLALAQFGLQLMASERPTLGGAVGEAGAQAIESLRGSYQDYNNTMMELYGTREQLAMNRARLAGRGGGGGGGGWPGLLSPQQELQAAERALAAAEARLADPAVRLNPAARSDAQDAVTAARERYGIVLRTLSVFGSVGGQSEEDDAVAPSGRSQ